MIKNIISVLTLSLLSATSYCQTKAVTDKGEEVILYADGTWKSASVTPAYETRLDTLVVTKDKTATFLSKSDKVNFGVWIDPKKWSFKPYTGTATTAPIEYFYTLKNEDAYAMLVTERAEVTYETLKEAAIGHAKDIDPSAHIVKEEVRNVNGNICHLLEYRASNKGMHFVYIGYFFASSEGTIQLLAFTTENLISKYRTEMEHFINGAVFTK